MFQSMDFEKVRDLEPGEAVFIDKDGQLFSQQCSENPIKRPCIFEYVYFARPDSKIDEISVYKARMRMGISLAKRIKELDFYKDIDVVITTCDDANESCTVFPGNVMRLHWSIDDPFDSWNVEESNIQLFRDTRNKIEERVRSFLLSNEI